MRQVKHKKKRKINLKLFLSPLCLILLGLSVILSYQFIVLEMIPLMLLIPVIIAIISITLIYFILVMKSKKRFIQWFSIFLSLVLIIGYSLGNLYVYKTLKMFEDISDTSDNTIITVSFITLKDSPANSLEDLGNAFIGVIEVNESDLDATTKKINEKGVGFQTIYYPYNDAMFEGLYNGEVDVIAFNEAYRQTILDEGLFPSLEEDTKTIDTTQYEVEKQYSSNPVSNVTQDPFTVLISGNDDYGQMATITRSDVNMLATVNPQTNTVLFTSIPRDYYVPQVCDKKNGCLSGEYDKLTHTGLHGVDTTKSTIEKFLDVEINYTVRVNFSSVISLVDALDGIDVYVEPGLAVDSFWTRPEDGVVEGVNHLNGVQALAFSRERYAYADGDAQRVRNQQLVILGILDKLLSPSVLINYGRFMDALGGAFETTMSSKEMSTLVKYQLTLMPEWRFEQYSLTGEVDMGMSAEIGDYVSVMYPDEQSVLTAKNKIDSVLLGKSSEDILD